MNKTLLSSFRLIGIITLWFLCLSTTNAQWLWQNPLPTGNNIRDLHFFDANNVIGIGFSGNLIRSEDGGQNWISITLATTKNIYSLHFINSTTGFATASGTLFKTTDGGNTWTESTLSGSIFYSIDFFDANNGIICGASGKVLRTNNGGLSWTSITTGLTTNLLSVSYGDINHVYISSSTGKILVSINGGLNWSEQSSGIVSDLNSIDFFDANNGIIVGSTGKVLRTTNGGVQWNLVEPTTSHLMSVRFYDSNNAVAVGQNIIRTTNAGETWSIALSNVGTTYLRSVEMYNSNGLAAGDYGMIYKTTNGGVTWIESFKAATKTSIRAADFIEPNNGIAVCESGSLVRTTNGGNDWLPMVSPTIINLFSVDMISSSLIYISGQVYIGQPATIFKTTDGGTTWIPLPGTSNHTTSIAFQNAEKGITAGTNIYTTRNGGSTWEQAVNPSGLFINSLKILSDSVVIAVGNGGTILRSGDLGLTWTVVTSGTSSHLISVDFFNELKGIAVGAAGAVALTTDGGLTWSLHSTLTTYQLSGVGYKDLNTIYAVGSNGICFNSTDSGQNWTAVAMATTNPLYSVEFPNSSNGFIFGHYGTILKLSEGAQITAPSNLAADPDTHFVSLSWTDNSNNELGFKIERKNDSLHIGGTWSVIGSVGANVSTYVDSGLAPITTYSYRVYAYNNDSNSPFSNSVQTITSLPVELTSFNAYAESNSVRLTWSTATELNNSGFQIERKIGKDWDIIGFVSGKGTITERQEYSFNNKLEHTYSGKISYRLKQIDYDGSFSYSNVINVIIDLTPSQYILDQNYPNPFNPSTIIKYSLPYASNVKVEIFNLLGQSIETLTKSVQETGNYELRWNAAGNASGIYFYSIEAGSLDGKNTFHSVKKMMLIR